MRLKEIKQGMAIMCHNFKQGEAVVKQLNRQGAGIGHYSPHYTDEHCVVYLNFDNQYSFWNRYVATCDFSDLILQELAAEEVWSGLGDVEDDEIFDYFQCGGYETRDNLILGAEWKDLVSIVEKHIAAHEKKEPEIETVDICRIIEIQPDGRERCVHEEDLASGSTDAEIKIMVEAELKRYCMEHEGEFIAVHEVVSRVKK